MRIDPRQTTTPVRPKGRLAAVILLGGWVRPTELSKAAGMNLLDLPIDAERTLLAQWVSEAGTLAQAWGVARLPLRILLDRASMMPQVPRTAEHVVLSLEHDPTELRGTAGVLLDACAQYDDEDLVLVANAGQVLFSPLLRLATCLASLEAGVAIAAHADGTPVTLMLVRCGCLREVPAVGYMDMKEQALPLLGRHFTVKAATFTELTCRGIRTRESYIAALQAIHAGLERAPLAENWRSGFQICQPGATVAPGARLHNSVILRGATIRARAVLVRSVAFPGAVVPPGAVLVDKLVSTDGILNSEEVAA